jgi:hypothetical protein
LLDAGVLAALSLLGLCQLIDGGLPAVPAALACSAGVLASSWLQLRRERALEWLCALDNTHRRLYALALLGLAATLGMLTIELPWNRATLLWGPSYWWLEIALVGLTLLAPYYFGGRRGSWAMPAMLFWQFVGVAQYFVRRFKNAAILPSDLLALGTAAAVSGQYTYSIDARVLVAAGVGCAAWYVLSLLDPTWTMAAPEPEDAQEQGGEGARGTGALRARWRRMPNSARGISCVLLCAALVLVPNYMDLFRVKILYWYSINYYENQGFLPTFVAVLQDMPIKKPKGYKAATGEEATTALASRYDKHRGASEERTAAEAQFEELTPSVIVVMNESFADLSVLDNLRSDYTGPSFFNSLQGTLWRGKLYVDVHGGGTCNSEFEFLTGNSLGYIGAGKYPYSTIQMVNKGIDSLASQLSALGYGTCAIHPNYASHWHRNRVYPALGFDRFLAIDDFGGFPHRVPGGSGRLETSTGIEGFHSGVSDQATYERILEELASSEQPQLFFDVTMQNHGSYNQKNIPADKLTNYQPTDTYEDPTFLETPARLNEYLSCIEESDRALEWLVGQLKELDRPVVLVFFGDHQPSLSIDYNDAWYQDEDDLTHTQRVYHANYLVWANYDVAGQQQAGAELDVSVDTLAARVLDAIGAPLSDYQKAQLACGTQILATNLHGYLGADGTWYTAKQDGPYAELYRQMALVEYHNFGAKL